MKISARLRKLFRNLIHNQEYTMIRYTSLATIVAISAFTATSAWAIPCKKCGQLSGDTAIENCLENCTTDVQPMELCWNGKTMPKGTCPPRPDTPPATEKCWNNTVMPKGTCPPKPDTPPATEKCWNGKTMPKGTCPPRPDGEKLVCDAEKHQVANAAGNACECMPNFEPNPADGGNCAAKCEDGESRDAEGVCKPDDCKPDDCKPSGSCVNPCAIAASKEFVSAKDDVDGMFGDLSFWLKVIVAELGAMLLLPILWFFGWLFGWFSGTKEKLDKKRKAKIEKKRKAQEDAYNKAQLAYHDPGIPQPPVVATVAEAAVEPVAEAAVAPVAEAAVTPVAAPVAEAAVAPVAAHMPPFPPAGAAEPIKAKKPRKDQPPPPDGAEAELPSVMLGADLPPPSDG